ncbi:MAG: cobalamin biosynthesis protein CbiA, partial [candidate division Zixibacteria bacterium]|nr:cobalamin biosynthesis protein CbiA [candidate division Zixibacteria bacterium]
MATDSTKFRSPSFSRRVLTIVGSFGSGKSEVAVNLARQLRTDGTESVSIADLDIINPYFRSREAARDLDKLGIRSILPHGNHVHADLPIIVPEVRGEIEGGTGTLVLDVGGDDLGARVLSSLREAFVDGGYELLLTLNANRPFTADVPGAMKAMKGIEMACQLRFTGIISNTHLMKETTTDTVLDGLNLARKLSAETGLPVCFVSATAD